MSIVLKQESITQSLHTNYTLESTLSCIFLFWDNNLCLKLKIFFQTRS